MDNRQAGRFDRIHHGLVGRRFWHQTFIQFILSVDPSESGRDESDPKRKTEDRHYDGNRNGKTPNTQRSSHAGVVAGLR